MELNLVLKLTSIVIYALFNMREFKNSKIESTKRSKVQNLNVITIEAALDFNQLAPFIQKNSVRVVKLVRNIINPKVQ
jgi:hypothetical protein